MFDFFQKQFSSSTNVSPFVHRGNNVSATVFHRLRGLNEQYFTVFFFYYAMKGNCTF